MKYNYDENGKLDFEFEAATQTEAWDTIVSLNEVFLDRQCKKCNRPNAKFHKRIAHSKNGKKEFPYYELRCQNPECKAIKTYGVINDDSGQMFPKNKIGPDDALFDTFKKNDDDTVAFLPHDGWLRYDKEKGVKF